MAEKRVVHTSSAHAYQLTIRSVFEAGVRRAPEQTVVYGDRVRLTYTELNERVHRLASALTSLGVRTGDVVATMDWDSNRYLECFFTVPMMGATLHTINVRLSPEQTLYTINHAQDNVIIVNADFLPKLEQIWDRIETKPKLLLVEEFGDTPITSLPLDGEYENLLAAAAPDFPFPELDEEERATIFYTTGTTGIPKGVYFSHRQLVVHTLTIASELGGAGPGSLTSGDVYMPMTPMFHVHAWGLPYVATMMGLKQVYPGRFMLEALLELVEREKVTFSHCVPTTMHTILSNARSREIDLRGWKILVGGASVPRALAREALERGIDIFSAYGLSETAPFLTLSRPQQEWDAWDIDRRAEARCRVGRAVNLVTIAVVDSEMRPLPHDGVSQGEIVVRAPWLTPGYLHDPAGSEKLWEGGWLHTGDVGVIDRDGYLRITDRLKDIIKMGGEWVSSLVIEDLLMSSGDLAEAAVIGVPDPKWTERPLAIVVAKRGASVSENQLKSHLETYADKGVIARFAVPSRIVFVGELPKTSVGKLDKKALRSRHAN